MNKIEVNEEFLEKPLMQYDAGMTIFTELLGNNDIIDSGNKDELIDLIEGKIGDLINVLKGSLDMNEKEFFGSASYAYIYLLFTTLRKNKVISKENIKSFSSLLNTQYPFPFPESDDIESKINLLNEEILGYTNFYLDKVPNKDDCIINKVACYDIISESNRSLKLLQDNLKSDPGNAESNRKLGAHLYETGKEKEAIVYLNKAIEINPYDDKAYNDMINIYLNAQDHENVIKYCLKYTYKNNGSNPFYIIMGDSYESLGKYEQAINSYANSEVTEYSIRRLLNIGDDLYNKEKLEPSKKAYKEIIKVTPNYFHPYNQIGAILFEQDEFEESLIYLKKALELEKYKATIYSNLAFTYYELGQEDEAIFYVNEAIKISSDKDYVKCKDFLTSLITMKNTSSNIFYNL